MMQTADGWWIMVAADRGQLRVVFTLQHDPLDVVPPGGIFSILLRGDEALALSRDLAAAAEGLK